MSFKEEYSKQKSNPEESQLLTPVTLKRKVTFALEQFENTDSEQDDLSLLNDCY
jgi:hypothetical protein